MSRRRRQSRISLASSLVAGFAATGAIYPASTSGATENFNDIAVIVSTVNEALETARTGTVTPWENAETGSRGSVTIERTYFEPDGTPCRDYVRETEGTPPIVTSGTGCREERGRWKLTESPTPGGSSRSIRTAGAASEEIAKAPEPPAESTPETASAAETPTPKAKPPLIAGSMPSRSN